MITTTFVELNLEFYHIDKYLPCHKMWSFNGYAYITPYEYSIHYKTLISRLIQRYYRKKDRKYKERSYHLRSNLWRFILSNILHIAVHGYLISIKPND